MGTMSDVIDLRRWSAGARERRTAARAERRDGARERRLCLGTEYSLRGGALAPHELVEFLRPLVDQPISRVARWVARREPALRFEQGDDVRFPVFQFEASSHVVKPLVRRVIDEFGESMSDQQLATWFVWPNATLDGARPVDLGAGRSADRVVQAARADRYLLTMA